MSDQKVVKFPRLDDSPPLTREQIQESVSDLYEEHIDSTLDPIVHILFDNMGAAGFPLNYSTGALDKDIALVVESIRSLMLKYYQREHKLQAVASELFDMDGETVIFKTDKEGSDGVVIQEVVPQGDAERR